MLQSVYNFSLYALTPLILITGEWRMKRTVAVIFAVFLCALFLAPDWPSARYAGWMIVADFVALAAVCWHPAGKWQSVIGATFALQMTVHFGRIIVGDTIDMNAYWWGLSITAIVQLLLLAWWWFSGLLPARRRGGSCPQGVSHSDTVGMVR